LFGYRPHLQEQLEKRVLADIADFKEKQKNKAS
jgi:hypothetical protein